MIAQQILDQYAILRERSGYVNLPGRTLLELSGTDRAAFLHNFCTADINRLEPLGVSEAFILDGRGKTLAHAHVINLPNRILLSIATDSVANSVSDHLSKFIIREDVQISDLSPNHQALFLAGATAQLSVVEIADLERQQARIVDIAGHSLVVCRTEIAGDGFLFLPSNEATTSVRAFLEQHDSTECSLESLTMVRLESGTPWFGIEIGDTNLPQEVRRDDQAISFNKGCYLGQETVAKIDAIGHVNKFLVGLQFQSETPPEIGESIIVSEQSVGQVLSFSYSPKLMSWLVLGYVKRQSADVDTVALLAGQPAKIVSLPV